MSPAKPDINQGRKFNAVWIIPLVAVLLGAFMVVQNYLNQGPEITIRFNTAEGLEAGKTRVKYRNIDMGLVEDVSLNSNLEHVDVRVRLDKRAEPLLREDSKFWVVRARIGAGAVTGLDTLLSGAYIGVSPGVSDDFANSFVGLEVPPPTPVDAPGLRLVLESEETSSLTAGDRVVYKGFDVGQVEIVEFSEDFGKVQNTIFIDAPYNDLITSSTRFWNISGVSFSTSTSGVEVSMGSLETLIHGGLTFGLPEGRVAGGPVESNASFKLYESYDEVLNEPSEFRAYFVVEFAQSLSGLEPGAPVEYRGIKLGVVEEILARQVIGQRIRQGIEGSGAALPVLIYIEPAKLDVPDTDEWVSRVTEEIEKAVSNGLRVSLQTGNLLTGSKYVDFDFYPDEPIARLGEFESYPVIPSIGTGLDQIEHKVISLLDKLNELPVEKTMQGVDKTLEEMEGTLESLRAIFEDESTQALPDHLEATVVSLRELVEDDRIDLLLDEAEVTLTVLQETLEVASFQLKGDSAEVYQLNKTLKEIELAARSLRQVLDLLEVKPEALISGKEKVESK